MKKAVVLAFALVVGACLPTDLIAQTEHSSTHETTDSDIHRTTDPDAAERTQRDPSGDLDGDMQRDSSEKGERSTGERDGDEASVPGDFCEKNPPPTECPQL